MPVRGELSEAEIDRLHTAFRAKLKDGECEVCGSHSWHSSRYLSAPQVYELRLRRASRVPEYIPFILATFTCSNCGNTKFFDIAKLGFVPDPDQEATDEAG